ncbi:MAG: homoserine kinase, partial [Leptospira sp.]|nr:homoserine kinase [Leptospira sp.]
MKLKKRISLRIPGTSANLGPGFDIMGLALRIYNKFEFEFAENNDFSSLLENGTKPPFEPEDDLVLYSYKRYFETFLKGENPLPYKVRMSLGLPIRGGLGSSASAAVAGFTSANYIHKKIFKSKKIPSKEEFLYELAMIEGHPDNTTPAFCGGLIFAYFTDEKKLHFFKRRFPGNISLLLFTPDFQTPTNDSRKKLPSEYPVKDVIYNMARVGTWMEFLRTKKFEHLLLALGDKL